jgi:hypothetical protein
LQSKRLDRQGKDQKSKVNDQTSKVKYPCYLKKHAPMQGKKSQKGKDHPSKVKGTNVNGHSFKTIGHPYKVEDRPNKVNIARARYEPSFSKIICQKAFLSRQIHTRGMAPDT